jgi:hypothetical protein
VQQVDLSRMKIKIEDSSIIVRLKFETTAIE